MGKTLRSAQAVIRDMDKFLEGSVSLYLKNINTLAKQLTPVRTGRAQRGWRITRDFKLGRGGQIENRVPYIAILDGAVRDNAGRTRGPIFEPAAQRAVYMTRRSN